MKNFKKLLTSMVAVVLAVVLSVTTANAANIEITQNTQDTAEHTYGAYQVLVGDLDGKTLSNVQWGSAVTADDEGKVDGETAAQFAKRLQGLTGEAATAAVEKVLGNATATKTVTGTGDVTIEGLDKGYYFVKDEVAPTDGSMTKFIVKLLDNDTSVTVTAKSSVPSVEKKVVDVNDTTGDTTGLQDSADYDIGDTVPYTVTATIGDGIENYTAYSFQFVDTMSKGLTLDAASWDIKVGEESIKDLFTLTSAAGADGATVWTWAAEDIKAKIAAGKKVVLTYNCTLNEDAVIGAAGNPNDVKLVFDNNPNNCGKGEPKGETPEDRNIVFTYKTIVNKVDEELDPLKGASFKLEKKLADGTTKLIKEFDVEDQSSFAFEGLDDGDYVLTETKTPKGYNSVAPIEFTISAEHEADAANPQLISLEGGDLFEGDVNAGTLTTDVVNEKGVELPETGGMGTTIFYTVGGLLVLGAIIMLIQKRRMAE